MSNIEIAAQKAGTMVAKLNGKQKLAFSFGIVVALAVALPVLTLAFAAVTNLFGLIVFGLATLGLLVATPMLLRKWKNKVLGFMISEAQANPILTLRNQSLERHAALDRAKKAASGMVGKINSLADDLAEFKEKHRKESGSRKIYDRMLPIVQSVQDRIKKAEAALSQFDLKIEEKSDEWDIMLKAGALKKALKDAGATDPLELILADAAFSAVRDAVNDELSQLDMLLADEGLNEIRALPAPSSASMIDLTAIDITPVEEEVQVTVPSRKTRRVQ